MKISLILNDSKKYNQNFNVRKRNINNKYMTFGIKTNKNSLESEVSCGGFSPSFGRFKEVKKIILKEKESGNNTVASLKREEKKEDETIDYKIFKNNEEAGYIRININPEFADNDPISIQGKYQYTPEVKYLRSLLGNKYSGIGTALIEAAKNESKSLGQGGALFTFAVLGFASKASEYRSMENPIPFYYKMGFRAETEKENEIIVNCLKNGDYNSLPEEAYLYLPKENE